MIISLDVVTRFIKSQLLFSCHFKLPLCAPISILMDSIDS